MGGGVNPIEWVLPPVAVSHLIVDQAARAAAPGIGVNPDDIPGTPGSPAARAQSAAQEADAASRAQRAQMQGQQDRATQELAARTETPQEAVEARRRAAASAQLLGGGKRRASQTLTTPGMTLSGSYP